MLDATGDLGVIAPEPTPTSSPSAPSPCAISTCCMMFRSWWKMVK